MRWFRGLAAGLLALCATPLQAQNWLYTVRPGDELWTLAARYCGSATYAGRIAAENGLADPSLLRPGVQLRIPVAWLVREPVTASVEAVTGEAYLLVPEQLEARAGQEVEMGHRLRTEDGSVVVRFADGSTLQVSARSEVLFNVLTAYGDTGMVDTNLRFYRGRSTSRIVPQRRGSRFRISTPSGTAAVRGTEFRVGVAAQDVLTFTETLDGEVGFQQGGEIRLPAGFGAVASPTGATQEPLLEAPVWDSPAGSKALGDTLRWRPLPGARGYRVSLFRQSDPINPVLEMLTDEPAYVLDGLEPAPYVVASRGISNSGLEGFDARLRVDVRRPGPATRESATMVRGDTWLEWQPALGPYRVEVSTADTFAESTDYDVDGTRLALPDLAPGHYYWRVRDSTSLFSAPGAFTVVPDAVGALTAESEALALSLRWPAVDDVDGYRVDLADDPDFRRLLLTREVQGTATMVDVPAYGRYFVRVVALHHGLAGEAATLPVSLQPHVPWWVAPVLLLPLLAL